MSERLAKIKARFKGDSLQKVPGCRVIVEPLQARILLSADLSGLDASSNDSVFNNWEEDTDKVLDRLRADSASHANSSHDTPPEREVVFVDERIADYEHLIDDLHAIRADDPHIEYAVVSIDAASNGFEQITAHLDDASQYRAIHVVSHGSQNSITLGNSDLSSETEISKNPTISDWANSLSLQTDIVIYGSEKNNAVTGDWSLERLASFGNAEAVASHDIAHQDIAGINSEFEDRLGEIESSAGFADEMVESWEGVLASVSSGSLGDQGDTSLYAHTIGEDTESVAYDSSSTDTLQINPHVQTSESSLVELVFVQSDLTDIDILISDLQQDASNSGSSLEIIVLDSAENGFEQVNLALESYSDLDAIHFVTHGAHGRIQIGDSLLSASNLDQHISDIQDWASALSEEADVLIYGCDVASTDNGRLLVQQLSRLTGADVAASVNTTGHTEHGGDWVLEYHHGTLDNRIPLNDASQTDWYGALDIAAEDSENLPDIVSGLILHNTFDVNASDNSGNNYHGTLINGATVDTNTATNQFGDGKLSLDGRNDYIDLSSHVANFDSLAQGTIAVWIYTDKVTGTPVIFQASDSGDYDSRLALKRNRDELEFFINDGVNEKLEFRTTSTNLTVDTWNHVVVTVDGAGNKVYVNGEQQSVSYTTGSASTSRFFNDVSELDFLGWGVDKYNASAGGGFFDFGGSDDPSFVEHFDGFLDDGRIYDRALTSSQVAALYSLTTTSGPQTFTVTNTLDDGSTGSLRWAIEQANANLGADTIDFDIPGNGTQVINLGADLPSIIEQVEIDGTTQTDWAEQSFMPIVIDGNDIANDIFTFSAAADDSEVRGLVVRDSAQHAIVIEAGASDITVAGNWLGRYGSDGSIAAGEDNAGSGVYIFGDNNTIGGTTDADRNVIHDAYYSSGVELDGSTATNNAVEGNYFGTGIDGNTTVDSTFEGYGVHLNNGASENTIGGATEAHGNVFGGIHEGVRFDSNTTSNNSVFNNNFGLGADGSTLLRVEAASVRIQDATNNVIGAPGLGNTFVSTVNHLDHLKLIGAHGTIIQSNIIGTDSTNTLFGGGSAGLAIDDSNNVTIGGVAAGEGNVITNNTNSGVAIGGASTYGITVRGNSIVGNDGLGVDINDDDVAQLNDVGDVDTGPNTLQNWAVLNSATIADDGTFSYNLDTTTLASGTYTVDFYGSTEIDGGQVEGERYLGTITIVSDGNSALIGSLPGIAISIGEYITLITTDINGNSSEFSSYVTAIGDVSNNIISEDIKTTESTSGGLNINADGGNDIYLVADNSDTLLGGQTSLSFETQFSASPASGYLTLLSYTVPDNSDEVLLVIQADGTAILSVAGDSVISTTIDYSTLVDGSQHSLGFTWDSLTGNWAIYADGDVVDSTDISGGSILSAGESIEHSGELVFGQRQNTLEGDFTVGQEFSGTLENIRLFNDVRTAAQMSASYRSDLPRDEEGMLAQWTFDSLSIDGIIIDAVSGNNLSIEHTNESGFFASESFLTLSIDENALDGTVVGRVYGLDPQREAQIASLLSGNSNLQYSAESGRFYEYVGIGKTWLNASADAQSSTLNGVSGNLISINSATENQIAVNMLNYHGSADAWIGASDETIEGEWHWYKDGAPNELFWKDNDGNAYNPDAAYANWNGVNPDNRLGDQNFARIFASTGTWDDNGGAGQRSSIVEYDADAVLDVSEALSYDILAQTVAGAFEIDNETGVIRVLDSSLLNAGTQAIHTITVEVTDVDMNTYSKELSISLNDLIERNVSPSDLSSGIELNVDGGNDAYLAAFDGGAILGGHTRITFETSFATTSDAEYIELISYAAGGSLGNDFYSFINGSDLEFAINSHVISLSGMDYASLKDGDRHAVAMSWDNTNGDYAVYIDGNLIESGTAWATGESINGAVGTGELIFGQEQDSVLGGFTVSEIFAGTLYDIRIWDEVRSAAEIAFNYQHKIDSDRLPDGLIANWQMDSFNNSNEIVDIVSGNNLGIYHASGAGFRTSTPTEDLHISEHASPGARVGVVVPHDPDYTLDVISDGTFFKAPSPASSATYTSDQSIGDWTVAGAEDVILINSNGVNQDETPLGGNTIHLQASTADSAIEQTLITEVGRQYQVVFAGSGLWDTPGVKQLRVSAGGEIANFIYDAAPENWSISNSIGWEHGSHTFTAKETETSLRFEDISSYTGQGTLLADVQVLEVPQSVSAMLNNDPTLDYDASTGKFYRFVNSGSDFDTQLAAALSTSINGIHGQLVTIRSDYENQLVQQYSIDSGNEIWLGATDDNNDGSWNWLAGDTETDEQFWRGGNTGNAENGFYAATFGQSENAGEDYVRLDSEGLWADDTSGSTHAYLIEWDAREVLSNFTFDVVSQDSNAPLFAVDPNTGEIRLANPKTPDSYNDHVAWFDASDASTVTRVGDTVTNVSDKTGMGNNAATLGTGPELISGAINGRDALQFDGASEGLVLSNASTINEGIFAAKTISVVFQTSADTANRQVLFEQGAPNAGINIYIDGGSLYAGVFAEGNGFEGQWHSTTIAQNETYVVTIKFDVDANEFGFYANGELIGRSGMPVELPYTSGDIAVGFARESTKYHDGDFSGTSHYYDGLIAELTYNNDGLSNNQIVDMHAHLMNKWMGVTTTLDYESATSHDVGVQVRDASGLGYNESITIKVDNGIEPTQTVPDAQVVDEGEVLTFSGANLNAITVSDTLSSTNSLLQVSISVSNGVLNLSQTTGLSFSGGGDGNYSMTMQGTESDINAALDGITFTPDSGYEGVVTLDMTTSLAADQTSSSDSVAITVNVNEPPYFISLPTARPENVASVTAASSVTSADIDNDGDIDLVSTTSEGELRWHENDGRGNFSAGVLIASANDFTSVVTSDLDGDGDMDIVAMNNDPSGLADSVFVLTNEFIGSSVVSFTTQSYEGAVDGEFDGGQDLVIGDIDGDGRADIAGLFYRGIGDSQLVVFEQNAIGTFTKTYSSTVSEASGIDIVDLDGDTDLDLIVGDFQTREITFYENDGNTTAGFSAQQMYRDEAEQIADVNLGDFDGDGDADIAYITNGATGNIVLLTNDGAANPTFSYSLIAADISGSLERVEVADTNGDGAPDLIIADKNDDSLYIYENTGDATFTRNTLDSNSGGPVWVEVAEVDGDGETDIIFASADHNYIGLHKNQGDGNYIRGITNEDVALSGLSVQVADDDAGTAIVEASIRVVNGSITLATDGVTVLSGASGTSAILFEGTLSDINTALSSLGFAPTAQFVGLGEVEITVNDRGHTGGPAKSATESLFIEVQAQPDAPSDIHYTTWIGSNEFVINTETSADQDSPAITALADGGFVVVWESLGQDSSADGVYFQRYDAAGNSIATETLVNTTTTGDQDNSKVTALANGGFVITWESDGQDGSGEGVFLRIFDANGIAASSEIRANSETSDNQDDPDIAALSNGGFVVVWESNLQDSGLNGIYFQRYNDSGVAQGSETSVNTTTIADQKRPRITGTNDGGFVVVWYDESTGDREIKAQRYDASGGTIGVEASINTFTIANQHNPEIVALSNGGFVVVWESADQDGDGNGIYGQLYTSAGVAWGSEFQISSETSASQQEVRVDTLDNGGFLAVWESQGSQDGDLGGVFAQQFDLSGTKVNGEFQVNTTTAYNQTNPALAQLDDGRLVAVWEDDSLDGSDNAVVGRIFMPALNENSAVGTLAAIASQVVDPDSGDEFFFSWVDDAGGAFALDENSGAITVLDPSLIDFENTASIDVTVRVTDSFASSYDEVVTIYLNNLDEVEITVPIAQTVGEDSFLIFSSFSVSANAVTVSDTLIGTDSRMQVTLSVADGELLLSQTNGLNFVAGMDGSGFMVIEGAESALNAAFEGMRFTPNAEFNGVVSLDIAATFANLQALYTFESGNADDQSAGARFDGTLVGNANTFSDLERGDVLTLDGDGDRVNVNSAFGEPQSITLSTWVNVSGIDSNGATYVEIGSGVGIWTANAGPYNLGVQAFASDGVTLHSTGTSENIIGTGWRHLAMTHDSSSGTLSMYLDGVLSGTLSTSGSLDYGVLPTTTIGAHSSFNRNVSGLMDDVHVYNRALSAEEIAGLATDKTAAYNSVTIGVDAINDAPVLDNTETMTFDVITEDEYYNAGQTVASVIASAGGDRITDVDGYPEGIAIIAHNLSRLNGWFEYSTDGGANWTIMSTYTSSDSLLLRDTDLVRFVPQGAVSETASLEFRAWDQTFGSAGSTADTSSNSGSSAFSALTETVSITTIGINDAPQFGTPEAGLSIFTTSEAYYNASDIVVLSNGSQVVVGTDSGDIVLTKFKSDGSVDTGFGDNGRARAGFTDVADFGYSIDVDASGRLLVAGRVSNGTDYDAAVIRFDANGSLDSQFASSGAYIYSAVGSDQFKAVIIQSDGKIIAAGNNSSDALIVRLNVDGSLDNTFNSDGIATYDLDGGVSTQVIKAISLQSDGKVIVAGEFQGPINKEGFVTRLTTTGFIDRSFGTNGTASTTFGMDSGIAQLADIVVQADDKIVVVGTERIWWHWGMSRFDSDGSLDTTFNTSGHIVESFGGNWGGIGGIAQQSDGKLIVSGHISFDHKGQSDWVITRYELDGSVDSSYGHAGVVEPQVGYFWNELYAMDIATDDSIVVAGYTSHAYSTTVGHFGSDGTLDSSKQSGLLDGNPTYTVGDVPVVLDADVFIFDRDLSETSYNGTTLSLSRNGGSNTDDVFSGGGTLEALTEGGTIVVDGDVIGTVITNSAGTLELTFNTLANQSRINEALGQITYSNSSDTPGVSVQIDWSFDDGNDGISQGIGGALQATGSTTVNIKASNNAPINAGYLPTSIIVTEDISSNLDISMIDLIDEDIYDEQLTLTLSTATGGELTATTESGIILGGTSTALTITGNLADLNAYLNSASNIQYLHGTANTNGDYADTIHVIINDNGNTGVDEGSDIDLGTVGIDIQAINDKPFNTGAIPTAVVVKEGVASNIDLNLINLIDVDSGNGLLTLTLNTATGGFLSAADAPGITLSGTSTALAISGTLADLNSYLNSVNNIEYLRNTVNSEDNQVDSIEIYINDNNFTGSGASEDIELGSINIDIVPTTLSEANPESEQTETTETTEISVEKIDSTKTFKPELLISSNEADTGSSVETDVQDNAKVISEETDRSVHENPEETVAFPEPFSIDIDSSIFAETLNKQAKNDSGSTAIDQGAEQEVSLGLFRQIQLIWNQEKVQIEQEKYELADGQLIRNVSSIDKLFDDRQEQSERSYKVMAQISASLGLTFATGYVTWVLQAGSMLASLLASMPMWRQFDPLPILSKNEKDDDADQVAGDGANSVDQNQQIAMERNADDLLK